jgi:hypothetical protein
VSAAATSSVPMWRLRGPYVERRTDREHSTYCVSFSPWGRLDSLSALSADTKTKRSRRSKLATSKPRPHNINRRGLHRAMDQLEAHRTGNLAQSLHTDSEDAQDVVRQPEQTPASKSNPN